jgi:hypothetical protein
VEFTLDYKARSSDTALLMEMMLVLIRNPCGLYERFSMGEQIVSAETWLSNNSLSSVNKAMLFHPITAAVL